MDMPEHIRSALHNFDRTAKRRTWRWERHVPARFFDHLEDCPPGVGRVPWAKALAPDDDDPELLAVLKEFEEQNRDLLERYRSTPTCEKRRRRGLRKELAHRLKRAGLISPELSTELCGEGEALVQPHAPQRQRRIVATLRQMQETTAQGGLQT